MNITITARKTSVRDSFKERIDRKLAKLDRFFDDSANAIVTVTNEGDRETVEVTIQSRGMFYRAEKTTSDRFDSLEAVVDSLFRQIVKNKNKLGKRLRDTGVRRGERRGGRGAGVGGPGVCRQARQTVRAAPDGRGGSDPPDEHGRARVLRLPQRGDERDQRGLQTPQWNLRDSRADGRLTIQHSHRPGPPRSPRGGPAFRREFLVTAGHL